MGDIKETRPKIFSLAINKAVLHRLPYFLPRTLMDKLVSDAVGRQAGDQSAQPKRPASWPGHIHDDPAPPRSQRGCTISNYSCGVRNKGQRKRGDNSICGGGKFVRRRVALDQFHILPSMFTYTLPGLIQHGIGQVDTNDLARGTNRFLQQWKIKASAATYINHKVTALQAQAFDRLCTPGFQRSNSACVIIFCLPPIQID